MAPEANAAPHWQGRSPLNIDNLLDIHEKAGVDMAVVTDTIHYIKGRSDAEALKAIQRWDEIRRRGRAEARRQDLVLRKHSAGRRTGVPRIRG